MNTLPVIIDQRTGLDLRAAADYIDGAGYDYAAAVEGARDALASVERAGIALGLYLCALKAREPHGRFLSALGEIGIQPRRAQLAIKRTQFVVHQLVKSKYESVSHLGAAKLDALIALPAPALEKVMDYRRGTIAGHPPADLARLSTREFKRVVLRAIDPARAEAPARVSLTPMARCQKAWTEAPAAERALFLGWLHRMQQDADLPWQIIPR